MCARQEKIPDDHFFMRKALALARKAAERDEVPIGAIVVDASGVIIGRGYNQVETRKSQRAHAEQLAIAQATKKRSDWRLDGCTIYITLEPCAMCMGLIGLSRLEAVVYGARSPLFGYQLDNQLETQLYKKCIKEVRQGIEAEAAAALLKTFFKQKRNLP
jgi:tRNA(adenine34) deaminase